MAYLVYFYSSMTVVVVASAKANLNEIKHKGTNLKVELIEKVSEKKKKEKEEYDGWDKKGDEKILYISILVEIRSFKRLLRRRKLFQNLTDLEKYIYALYTEIFFLVLAVYSH